MSLLLSIDTADQCCRVAVLKDRSLISSVAAKERYSAEALGSLVQEACSLAECTLEQVGKIVVCVGPGSFTGIRSGISYAQGLSLGLDIPLVGVSSMLAGISQFMITGDDKGGAENEPTLCLCSSLRASKSDSYALVSKLSFAEKEWTIERCSPLTAVSDDSLPEFERTWSQNFQALNSASIQLDSLSEQRPYLLAQLLDLTEPQQVGLETKGAKGANFSLIQSADPQRLEAIEGLYVKALTAKTIEERLAAKNTGF